MQRVARVCQPSADRSCDGRTKTDDQKAYDVVLATALLCAINMAYVIPDQGLLRNT